MRESQKEARTGVEFKAQKQGIPKEKEDSPTRCFCQGFFH